MIAIIRQALRRLEINLRFPVMEKKKKIRDIDIFLSKKTTFD